MGSGSTSLEQHIERLCREHMIERIEAPGRGRAWVNQRLIKSPSPRTLRAYFVSLHEIAHILVGLEDPRLEREALCWDLAVRMAIVSPTLEIRQLIAACLLRYLCKNTAENIPDETSPFWPLLRWWEPLPYKQALDFDTISNT